MLIFKSQKKFLLVITLVLMAIYAFNNVFLSIILSNIISAATLGSMSMFLNYAFVGVAGFGIFTIIGVVMVRCKTKLQLDLNLAIKQVFIHEIIYHASVSEDYARQLSFMTNDLKQLETKGIEAEFTMLSLLFSFLFALITAFFYHFWIALVFFIGSLTPLLVSLLAKKSIHHASHQWIMANANYTNRLKDYFTGLETIRTYHVEAEIIDRSNSAARSMEIALQKMNVKVETVNQLIYMGVMVFSLLIPFGFGVVSIIQFGVPLATFIAIVQLSNSLRSPSLQIMQHINAYATIKEIKHKYMFFREKPLTIIAENSVPFISLELREITLKHEAMTLFENLSLKVQAGDKVLIIGPSGIGKSSLLRLIQYTLKPSYGDYLVNGEPIGGQPTNYFSLIRQQPLIFDETLLYNITLGETFSDELIARVIDQAQLTDVVQRKGLNYQVGENGLNLSTGELQRIEIARALLRQRAVLLADEITSSLDDKTAHQLREMLLTSPYTVVEVAHHLDPNDKERYTQIWDLSTMM